MLSKKLMRLSKRKRPQRLGNLRYNVLASDDGRRGSFAFPTRPFYGILFEHENIQSTGINHMGQVAISGHGDTVSRVSVVGKPNCS